MFMLMSGLVTAVKEPDVGQGGTNWPSSIFSRSKYLMFRVWTSWALFYLLGGIDISWLQLIMCQNGWKPLLAPPMIVEWLLGSLRRFSFPAL